MALFAWLQRRINQFLQWIGFLEDTTESWDTLKTQLNLLDGLISGQTNLLDVDHEIKQLPISDGIIFPYNLWLRNKPYFPYCVDETIYVQGWSIDRLGSAEDSVAGIYTTKNLSTYTKLTSIDSSIPVSSVRYANEPYFCGIISDSEYNYFRSHSINRSSGRRTSYTNFSVITQAMYLGNRIQFVLKRDGTTNSGKSYDYTEWMINGSTVSVNFPIYTQRKSQSITNTIYEEDINVYYNSMPLDDAEYYDGMGHMTTGTYFYPYYTQLSISGGDYLYIGLNDLLYQYNSSYALQNIYYIPFPHYGTLYFAGNLYFISREGLIKCNLS